MPANPENPQWLTSAWIGTGQPVIYHAVNYGLNVNDTVGTENAQALMNAINAAFAGSAAGGPGGIVFIPAGTYAISGPLAFVYDAETGQDSGIVIMGAGGSTELVQQDSGQPTFSFTGYTTGRGIRFKDLRITYVTAMAGTGAAIFVEDCQNVTCERVYFNNCPQAVNFNRTSNQCGMHECTVSYANFISGAVMVFLGGSYNFIDNCLIVQATGGSPSNCTGIEVQPGGGLSCITNTHISDFWTGISVLGSSNLVRLFASNVVCESFMNAVTISPGGDGNIYDVFFNDCLFQLAEGSSEAGATGVIIGAVAGDNSAVANVFLNNCICYGWAGPGVQINSGQDIVITGGRYSANAHGTDGGGIAVTGTAADVTVSGADLTPKVLNPDFPAQAYAISVTAEVQGLYVRGCDLTDYGTPNVPLFTSGAGTQIEITDCAGYNDQGMILQETAPPIAARLANTYSWTNAPNGWFGPIAFYVTGTGNVSIGNATTSPINTHLSSGGFTLSAGQIATIAAVAGTFLAIGQ